MNIKQLTLTILAALTCLSASLGEQAMSVKPALNEPPQLTITGTRPYEMKDRKEDRVPLFGFEDVTGWSVQCIEGADAELVRTREQQMWGEYVGKLTYSGRSGDSKVVIRPPSPIPISETFDCIGMWIYGNVWEWAPEPETPQAEIFIILQDPSGREELVHMTRIRWKEWWYVHRKLAEPRSGWSFSGIEVRGTSNREPRSIFFDSIYFYKEVLKPLRFAPRPRRNITLFDGQSAGLNTGPGVLPFPTREETILPSNTETDFTNWAANPAIGRYEFGYSGKDCNIKYVYEPKTGNLGEIKAYFNGKRVCTPMIDGGIEYGEGKLGTGKLISESLEKNVLSVSFDLGGITAIYRFRIWQKSLVIDFECRGGKATGVALGKFEGVENPRLVRIPYITLGGGRDPRVLCWGKPQESLFASVWVDWYRSNGSVLWSEEWVNETSAKINGGVRYIPKTDGKRNDLFERVFLTISHVFEETLPNIPNPRALHGKPAGERLWQESWGPDDYEKQHARSKVLRSYGIDKLTQCNHEITWRDGGESFTLRTKAAPGKGGDEALKRYVANQKSLGWLSGLYTNYCDLAPVNEYWDEDLVQRTPDGQLRPAWPRCYALKPARAVEFEAKLAPTIKKKFGSNAAYTDVHTAASPWGYTDFDARVPGAGTFAATFYAYGELLLNDQKIYGPTWSEGTFQWMYAGLATGNYALCYGSTDLSKEPLNVAFDLLKIHPLELDIGMPWTSFFFKESGWDEPDRLDESIDHFLAATVAYGHIGWLVEETYGIERTCRSYYMLQQLQKRYALQKPVKIEYADTTGQFVNVSQAIARGIINDSRIHIIYENGLEVFVNGSKSVWTIRNKNRQDVHLPPWGWYASQPETKFEEFSTLVEGRRVDYVSSPEYEFLDGRGVPTMFGGLAASGSIAVRRHGKAIEVTDIYGNSEIGIKVNSDCFCTAFDPDGKSLGAVETRRTADGMVWFRVKNGARRYVLLPHKKLHTKPQITLKFSRNTTVPGEVISGKAIIASSITQKPSEISVGIEGFDIVVHPLIGSDGKDIHSDFQLPIPKNVPVDSWLWIKASAIWPSGGEETIGWHVMSVRNPFEIKLLPVGNNRFTLEIQSNLHEDKEPQVRYSFKHGDRGLRLLTPDEHPGEIVISLDGEPREVEDLLIVDVTSDSFQSEAQFKVKSAVEYPIVWNLSDAAGFSSGYAYRGGPELGPNSASGATFNIEDVACAGIVKRAIFAHPPWIGGVGYTWGKTHKIRLPDTDCELRTFIGIRDGGGRTDGVIFAVTAIDDVGNEHILFKELWDRREWKEVSADLTAFKGKELVLKFTTDVGPNDDSTSDWAAWGEPKIATKSAFARIQIKR